MHLPKGLNVNGLLLPFVYYNTIFLFMNMQTFGRFTTSSKGIGDAKNWSKLLDV